MKVYCTVDKKMNNYCSNLFEAESDNAAIASLLDACAQPHGTFLALKLQQSDLVCLGSFDHDSCVLTCDKYIVAHGCDLPFYGGSDSGI